MDPPGGNDTPAGGICTHCPHGQIEVIVWKHAVCWDTPDGTAEDSTDSRFEGVAVRLNEVEIRSTQDDGTVQILSRSIDEKTTGRDGKVTFTDLLPTRFFSSSYTVTAHKDGYDDVTQEYVGPSARTKILGGSNVNPARRVAVEEQQTAKCDLILRAKLARLTGNNKWTPGRECGRRHARPALPQPGESPTLAPMFWDQEPKALRTRDILWLLLTVATAGLLVIGCIVNSMTMLSIAAICAAFFAYLTGYIFGEIAGTIAIAIAAVASTVLLAVNLLAVALGFTQPDPYGVGIVAGIWAAFAFGYAPGRRDEWRKDQDPVLGLPRLYYWASALIGGVTAGLIAGVILIAASVATHTSPSAAGVIFLILAIVLGAFFGGFSGWTGFAFANEGKTQMGFGATDYKLPYLGERYCLQGARGYWSHFDAGDGSDEGSYDWAMPSADVFSSKEGHIVSFYDEEYATDSSADTNNYVAIRHKDGSIARYSRLRSDAFSTDPPHPGDLTPTAWPRNLGAAIQSPKPHDWFFAPAAVKPSATINPLHVLAGHRLARTDCRLTPASATDGDSTARWVALIVAACFGVGTFIGVIAIGYTSWNGEPKKVMYVNSKHDWFTKLFNTSDSAYSYGWPQFKVPNVLEQLGLNNFSQDIVEDLQLLVRPPADVNAPALPPDLTTSLQNLLGQIQSSGAVDASTLAAANSQAQTAAAGGQLPPGDSVTSLSTCTAHPYKFDRAFCECLTFGGIKQWGNTLSDIGFVLFGIFALLLLFALWGPSNYPYVNRLTYSVKYTFVYGLVIIFMGPGSMLFHIGFAASGGLGDGISMYLFGGFMFAYGLTRLLGYFFPAIPQHDQIEYWALFLPAFVIAFFVPLCVNVYLMQKLETADKTTMIMLFLVPPGVILLLVTALMSPHDGRGWVRFLLALGCFGIAFLVWGLSHTGRALCHPGWPIFSPESWFQGHALWHIFSAGGVLFVYWFLYYEKDTRICTGVAHLHMTVSEAPPAGPSLDIEIAFERDTPAQILFKPVKFVEMALAVLYESRPWSLRKAMSQNIGIGMPKMPPDLALFKPMGGEHAPDTPFEGVDQPALSGATPQSASSDAMPGPSAPSIPSIPGAPGGVPGGVPSTVAAGPPGGVPGSAPTGAPGDIPSVPSTPS